MADSEQLDELESLLISWEEGELDEAGVIRLQEILREDETARKRFVRMQMVRTAIMLEADAGIDTSQIDAPSSKPATLRKNLNEQAADSNMRTSATPRSFRSRFSMLLAIAASPLLCLLIGRWAILESTRLTRPNGGVTQGAAVETTRDSKLEATSQGIALITRLVDVELVEDSRELRVGQSLSPGKFSIESGLAQIEFFCGATVVLEGPAEIDLQSSVAAHLLEGRLRAQVPPAARGFTITTEEMKVVDLGTEFGLSVRPDADGVRTTVQVFDGEVELHQPELEKYLVKAGQAVLKIADGELTDADLTPDDYVDIAGLTERADDRSDIRFEKWLKYSRRLRTDERLIAYYSMDGRNNWNRKLRNDSRGEDGNRDSELDGAIVGARQAAGRWSQKSALEFKLPPDRVRVDVPGEYDSLTFAAWVKIDSLDRWYNSLFLTDNYQQGEPHWQILDTGQLFFSVRVTPRGQKGPEHREVLSPVFWKPSMSGQWLHLATSYNVQAKQVTHFLNGEVLSRESIPDIQLVKNTRIGTASIGNWSVPTKPDEHFAIRNLNGSIDEFALFAAAIDEEEVRQMYEIGKP